MTVYEADSRDPGQSGGDNCIISIDGATMVKKLLIAIAGTVLFSVASAQSGDAVNESAKATAEGAKEAGDQAKAAVHSGPEKAMDKAKAKGHKASARYHRHRAKAAADAAVH
jgi:hypothetical protein